jgi:hypothetical protein
MPDAIEIKQLRLEQLAANQINAAMARSTVAWYQFTAAVKNVSATPQYVLTEIHRLAYDSKRRTLQVQFSEQDLPAERAVVDVPPPAQYRAIAPGEEVQLGSWLSSPITFMQMTGKGPQTSFVRIPEDVDAIECTVAYDSEPPLQTFNLAALEPLRDTRDWGATISRSFRP